MRDKRTKREKMLKYGIIILVLGICVCSYLFKYEYGYRSDASKVMRKLNVYDKMVKCNKKKMGEIDVLQQFLPINDYSRPGRKLEGVNGIVIHYTGNPGTSASGNYNYFKSLAVEKVNYASSHFLIGLEGEVIQCVPLDEEAFATRTRNKDTIGIEVCHPDSEGKFNDVSYKKLIKLTAYLCDKFQLTEKDVMRHYDVTGKMCPRYYVEHESEWEKMLFDIKTELKDM